MFVSSKSFSALICHKKLSLETVQCFHVSRNLHPIHSQTVTQRVHLYIAWWLAIDLFNLV
uniref:Uncharacterized protein n=1 Tax=Arundo donax TaxID=35708 RepID=A0A0A9G7Y1_ARUDO